MATETNKQRIKKIKDDLKLQKALHDNYKTYFNELELERKDRITVNILFTKQEKLWLRLSRRICKLEVELEV